MPELLREPAELRRRIEQLEQNKPAGRVDDTYGEALAEAYFRLAVHHSTPVREATALLQRAAKIDGGNPKYAYHLGRIFLSHGRLDLAGTWLSAAARLCPTSHRIWTHISLLQKELDESFREDETVLRNDLRQRASDLAARVEAGADRVDESLLSLKPRKVADAQGSEGQPVATTRPETSESGDGRPTSAPDVRRLQNPGRCRWSGVIDLNAEELLESVPGQDAAKAVLRRFGELQAAAARRKGGRTGLAVLAVEWLVRGYPVSTIRNLIGQLQTPAKDHCIEALETCCALFEADEAELPRMLADRVHENAVPPLLAALIHERRLLWNVPRLGRLGAAFRMAERFLAGTDKAEGDGCKKSAELRQEASAILNDLDRVAGEVDCKPPMALKTVAEVDREAGPEKSDAGQRLQELRRQLEVFGTQFDEAWPRVKELDAKFKKQTLDESDLSDVAAILERFDTTLPAWEDAEKELNELRRSGVSDAKDKPQLERLWEVYLELKPKKGRISKALHRLSRAKPRRTEPEPDDKAAAAPAEDKVPTDPLELLAHKLKDIESRIRERFEDAERTFSEYDEEAIEIQPIKALRRTVGARKAEALYRLGRRQEARRIWVAMLREDPLDANASKNVAVCDSVRRDLAHHLQSWKSYIELLYYFDIVACDPRPHARERAAFHRDFAGAYAPRFLADEKLNIEKVDATELKSFLASPRLAVFLGHKLLEILNEKLDYSSPPIILGIDRSAREEVRERARESTHFFVRTVGASLPERIREAFCDITRKHIDAAFEATASARRLTLKQDAHYSEEKKRYAEWLTAFVKFKIRLFNVTAHHIQELLEAPNLEWIGQLRMLDSIPIGNSPEFMQQFVDQWERVVELMGSLEDLAIKTKVEVIEAIKENVDEEAFAGIVERWIGRLAGAREPDPDPAIRALDALHRLFTHAERRLDREREVRATAEGRESGDRDSAADRLEQSRQRLVGAMARVFLPPLVWRYNKIMSQTKEGIETDSQAQLIESQLQQLRRSVAALEPLIGTHEDCRELCRAIDKILGDFGIRAELDIVNQLMSRYKEIVEPIEPPLSAAEAESLRSEMQKLKKSVTGCRRKVHSAEATKRLDELSKAIENLLTQLEG